MNSLFVLKDNLRADPYSKINNFTYEWSKWFPFAKMVSSDYNFNKNDIVIINIDDCIYDCSNIFCSQKIGIVFKITKLNIEELNNCSYLIYLNPLLQKIAESQGIKIPYTVCPNYPKYIFEGIKLTKLDRTYCCGWINDDNINLIENKIIASINMIPKIDSIVIGFCYGISDKKQQLLNTLSNKLAKNDNMLDRKILFVDKLLSIQMLLFNLRISTSAFIESNSPTIEEINDLIKTNNSNILSYNISENSMLSIAKSCGCNIICDIKSSDFISLNNTNNFSFNDFAKILKNIVVK